LTFEVGQAGLLRVRSKLGHDLPTNGVIDRLPIRLQAACNQGCHGDDRETQNSHKAMTTSISEKALFFCRTVGFSRERRGSDEGKLIDGVILSQYIASNAKEIFEISTPVPAAKSGLEYNFMKTPNIVILLADDMGCGDPGCYNPESKVPTPNIDRLAREGMLFTNAYCLHPDAIRTSHRPLLVTLGAGSWRDV